jgi:hypothetical protein
MMKRFSFYFAALFLLLCITARAQIIVAGSPLIYSNAYPVIAIPVNLTLNSSVHSISVNHGGLLATTNMSAYFRVALVDAVTGTTNYVNVAQVWQAQNTNSATETIALTNYSFQVTGSILWTTTNAMNIPTSLGAATYVTNSAVLNY